MPPRLKVYPRLQLHITFGDLIASLFSFFHISDRERNTREIQLFWQGNKEALVTLSVRTSLDLLLQSLKLPPGSEVLMSAVNIRDMVEIVKRHGLVPIPVDISLDTLAPSLELLENLISEKSRIFILAHLFGSIIDLEPYTQLCRKNNILLIEDCAQGFAGSHYYGHQNADVSLFSFGSIKSCTALGGAVALIEDKNLADNMKSIEQQYSLRSEFWFFQRILKYFALKFFSIPGIYYYLLSFLSLLYPNPDAVINSMTRGFSQGDILSNIRYRPPNRMLWLLNRRLKTCNNQWFEWRGANAKQFLSMLLPEISCPGNKADYNSFWVFPILVLHPELLIAKLRENGFDSTRGNTSLTCVDSSQYQDKPSTLHPMNGKYLIEHVIYLPVTQSLSETERLNFAKLVNEFYK